MDQMMIPMTEKAHTRVYNCLLFFVLFSKDDDDINEYKFGKCVRRFWSFFWDYKFTTMEQNTKLNKEFDEQFTFTASDRITFFIIDLIMAC